MVTSTSESETVRVNVAHSADVHGALMGIVSPTQIEAATSARKYSETVAAYEIGDWTERAAASSAQLVGFTRISSQRRVELLDEVLTGSVFCTFLRFTCLVLRLVIIADYTMDIGGGLT